MSYFGDLEALFRAERARRPWHQKLFEDYILKGFWIAIATATLGWLVYGIFVALQKLGVTAFLRNALLSVLS